MLKELCQGYVQNIQFESHNKLHVSIFCDAVNHTRDMNR